MQYDSSSPTHQKQGIDVSMICPGPIHTSENSQNTLTSSLNKPLFEREKHKEVLGDEMMSLERCSQLYTSALKGRFLETWISQNPVLLFAYIRQYTPWLVKTAQKLFDGKYE